MTDIFANVPHMRGRGLTGLIGRAVLRTFGWSFCMPENIPEKCVIIVYPHTSNWDFPLGLCAKWASGVGCNYLAKASLFRSPLGWFFRATGGIAVDRQNPAGLVGQMIQTYSAPGPVRFVIAPEGTRTYKPALKSGFHRIAVAANVPLACAKIDYATKTVGVFAMAAVTGDPAVDAATLQRVYAGVRGLHPEKMGPLSF